MVGRKCLFGLFICVLIATPVVAEPGRLVIVGGALDPNNAAVWRAFVTGLPNPDTDRVAVIASASGEPVASFEAARDALVRHGVSADRVILIRAAVVDDPATAGDESLWSQGGNDPAVLDAVDHVGGVWFTGGDQARTARVLFDSEGSPTRLLDALRRRLADGAAIGGSSAGAAIQSATMILRGDGLIALSQPIKLPGKDADMEDGRLIMATGAGFFEDGIIDQHFDRQARLGRLSRAVTESELERFGYGIDENTALVVDTATRTAVVLGAGTVTILDDSDARRTPGPAFGVEGLGLSIASSGDRIDLRTGAVAPAAARGRDAMAAPDPSLGDAAGTGPGFPARSLVDVLNRSLLGTNVRTLDRISIGDGGTAVRFRFEETQSTSAMSGRGEGDDAGTTIRGLRLSINPVIISVDEFRP